MLHRLPVAIAILLAAAGCHSPSSPSPSRSCAWPPPNGTMSVAIDGTPWAVSGAEGGLRGDQFSISAGGLDCAFFNITVFTDVLAKGPTTYSIEADTPRTVAYYSLPGVGPGPDFDILQWRAQSAFSDTINPHGERGGHPHDRDGNKCLRHVQLQSRPFL